MTVTMTSPPVTWADGYGNWHVRLDAGLDVGASRKAAVKAISAELVERYGNVEVPTVEPDPVHHGNVWREVTPDD